MVRPSLADRVLARLVAGSIGHLAAGALDWLELFARWQWAKRRGRPMG